MGIWYQYKLKLAGTSVAQDTEVLDVMDDIIEFEEGGIDGGQS